MKRNTSVRKNNELTRRGVRHRVRQRRAATAANVDWGKRAGWYARLWIFRNSDFGKSVSCNDCVSRGNRRNQRG